MTPAQLRALLARRGETVPAFAAKVGRSPRTVQYWLAGRPIPQSVRPRIQELEDAPRELTWEDRMNARPAQIVTVDESLFARCPKCRRKHHLGVWAIAHLHERLVGSCECGTVFCFGGGDE